MYVLKYDNMILYYLIPHVSYDDVWTLKRSSTPVARCGTLFEQYGSCALKLCSGCGMNALIYLLYMFVFNFARITMFILLIWVIIYKFLPNICSKMLILGQPVTEHYHSSIYKISKTSRSSNIESIWSTTSSVLHQTTIKPCMKVAHLHDFVIGYASLVT